MFCPKCSQQQVSDETRFCSRCGFQLNIVKALLVNDDIPLNQNVETAAVDRSLRKRDLTIGAGLMFFLALISAIITVDMPPSHSARIILLSIAWLILSLLINIKPIINYLFHGDATISANKKSMSEAVSNFASRIESNISNPALPSAQSVPVSDFVMPRRNTMEIVPPPSVTEPTTNLLDNK